MISAIKIRKHLSRAFLLAVVTVGALAGCASPESNFASVDEVAIAFTKAGGECQNPTEMPAFNAGFGIFGLNCESGDAVLWFADADAKKEWLSLLEGTSEPYVEGNNWLVMTGDKELVTSAMGGQAHN